MSREELDDRFWALIEPHLPGKASDPGRTAADNRVFLEAVLWMARTGAHWRALPERFGKWNTVYVRFNRWCRDGVFERLFKAMQDEPDFEYILVDSTIVRAHQHSAGARKGGLKLRPSAAPRGA